MEVLKELNRKKQELEKEMRKLDKDIERISNLDDPKALATFIHDATCHHDHTEACGWFYEKEWTGYTKKRYLEKANKLLKLNVQPSDIVRIVEIIKGY